jgi:hypothetical protein
MPRPPSLNGKQIDCQATLALVWVREEPFHKNVEKILSIFLIVVQGRMNREVQYICIKNKTDLMSCRRLACMMALKSPRTIHGVHVFWELS